MSTMTLDDALHKLREANALIFEVEHMFDDDKDDEHARHVINGGFRARHEVGLMQHELLIRKGIRQR